MTGRLGPRQTRALLFLRKHGGSSKIEVARYLYPGAANIAVGYQPVNRCIQMGLVRAEEARQTNGNGLQYRLYLTDLGRTVIRFMKG